MMQEILLEIIKIIFVLALSFTSIMFFIAGLKIIFADKATYKRNHKSTAGFLNAIRGTVPTKRDGTRSHNVVAGLAYDVRAKKIVAQGTLSNEAIESILR
ncbi:MAG: hypothetical protein Q8Q50_01075 [Methylobacter sp.]|nr:hypothetical protein [Methylobacter sp.]